MITIKKGDIIEALKYSEIRFLAHGVNCSGGFGSGIAGQIAKEFPKVRNEYLKKYKEGRDIYHPYGWMLGDIQPVEVEIFHEARIIPIGKKNVEIPEAISKPHIINCAIQKDYGSDGKEYVDYEAVRDCMKHLKVFANHSSSIGIPRIGSGLAGGDWSRIENIIVDVFDGSYDTDITIYTL